MSGYFLLKLNQMKFSVESLLESEMTEEKLNYVMNIERHSFNPPWSSSMFLEELTNPNSRCLVFSFFEKIVAFECFWIILDEAHLLNVAVTPEFRGLGIGIHMMRRLEDICAEKGVKRILLDVARRNDPARNLYKKAGFNSIGFRKRYYPAINDDAIVMEKWLSQNIRQI